MPEGSSVTVLIPLPFFYNPDRRGRRKRIEDKKFDLTAEEVAGHFKEVGGGGILHRFPRGEAKGFWWNQGIVDKDVVALLEVDVPDNAENRAWLKAYAKDVLLKRFCQQAIYMKFVGPVETLLVMTEEIVSRKIDK